MSGIIHKVKRGSLLMSVESRLHELKSLSDHDGVEINSQELISFCQNFKLEHQYVGSEFTNSFIVDKNISIVGVGFFGPRYVSKAKYLVRMSLDKREMDGKKIKKSTLAKTEKAAVGVCGEVFTVDFDSPVELDPSAIKYTISFKLIGPETMGLDPIKIKCRENVEGVKFFFWPGSQQMPEIRFTKNYTN